jgi:hypothetical protein
MGSGGRMGSGELTGNRGKGIIEWQQKQWASVIYSIFLFLARFGISRSFARMPFRRFLHIVSRISSVMTK